MFVSNSNNYLEKFRTQNQIARFLSSSRRKKCAIAFSIWDSRYTMEIKILILHIRKKPSSASEHRCYGTARLLWLLILARSTCRSARGSIMMPFTLSTVWRSIEILFSDRKRKLECTQPILFTAREELPRNVSFLYAASGQRNSGVWLTRPRWTRAEQPTSNIQYISSVSQTQLDSPGALYSPERTQRAKNNRREADSAHQEPGAPHSAPWSGRGWKENFFRHFYLYTDWEFFMRLVSKG